MADRVILHSDINCCYASIEHLHHPELAGKPLAVGGDPEARHGIVLTADYIAKKYGVKTGMALWQAKQVCPNITFVSPRMDLYLRFSRMAHEIYAEYTDMQEPYGIDECWLDVTGSSSLKGDGLLIAQEISRRMKSELGITVSVGVSFNKIFAKLGSDYKKLKEIEYKMATGKFEVQKCAKLKELLQEYIKIYSRDKWGVSTYDGNISIINNYIIPTIGETDLKKINTHFLEKYYQQLLSMPAVKGSRNKDGSKTISTSTVNEIHKILRSCFRQGKKWNMMEKNPAEDATVPKHKKAKREIWTADMLMQAINACNHKWLQVAFHLSFTATLRLGELLGLTWDCVDITEEAINENRAYINVNKQVERVSKKAVEELNSKEVILIFPSIKKDNKTVRVLKTPKTESSIRRVYIPKSVALCLVELKKEQDEVKEALGSEYQDYNLVMATTFGFPIGDSNLRDKMQQIIDEQGLPDVVFHSIRHTSVTYKLKLSGGDIKAVQGDSGHAQADMVTEVYGHIIDEDRRKNAELMENAFYSGEDMNPDIKGHDKKEKTVAIPDGVDPDLLLKVLANPDMAALLTSLAKTMNTK